MLDGEQDGPGPFPTEGETLHDAQQEQQDRCDHTHLRVGGQDTHQRGGDAHDEHRQREGLLASDPVADVAEDDTADGSDHETHGEGREGQHRADERTLVGEEQLVEHQARSRRVEEEVVPLHRGAEQARRDHGS